jgi:hypothetical protein
MKGHITEIEKARQVESKDKSMLIIFFCIRGIVYKEFILIGQTVNSAYCYNVLRRLRKNVQNLLSELWRQKYWYTPSNNYFFASDFITKTNITVAPPPHPHYFSPFLRLKIKL